MKVTIATITTQGHAVQPINIKRYKQRKFKEKERATVKAFDNKRARAQVNLLRERRVNVKLSPTFLYLITQQK